jgi:hypothetical protein
MKTIYLLGLLLIVILTICACNKNNNLNGTWHDGYGTEYRFDDGYWETWNTDDNEPMSKGYYTINKSTITNIVTHVYINGDWLVKNSPGIRNYIDEFGLNETEIDIVLEKMFLPNILTFSNGGNTLIITKNHEADGVITTITTTIKRK